MDFRDTMKSEYRDILEKYMKEKSEQALYAGQMFSRTLMEHKIAPEEIISIHKNLLHEMYPDLQAEMIDSFDILLEVMMGYGIAYREHLSLRHKQQELRTEMEIAAAVQKTLLRTKIPKIDGLDIGVISVPAKHMNGDYYHFVQDENDCISVAIADVIGKGIPAALCMSMIKYAMESLPENRNEPSEILENINRVVEQNVDPSMFITMLYGKYNPKTDLFTYASAGHEPGFYYCADKDEFFDLEAKGLLLGFDKRTKYSQFEQKIHAGDMIILMTDGVTECRTDEGFIERETLIGSIKKYIHLSAQTIVQNVFKELEKLQHFQLRDDFTLIILKKMF
jgi:phosphoserine phosphatase RsbU/P